MSSFLFSVKRKLYLFFKPIVNAVPLLKKINRKRRQAMGTKEKQAVIEHGLSTAVDVVNVLENGGFEPVLVFGSLLGAVREGRFLRHDYDLDFGVEVDDNETWARLRSCMEEGGYKIARQYSVGGLITEQAYHAQGFTFDVWGLMPIEGSDERRAYYHCLLDEGQYESEDDRSIKYLDLPPIGERVLVEVDGVELPIPANAEECLTRAYTEHWRVPDPTWVSGTEGGWKLMEGVVERRMVFEEG